MFLGRHRDLGRRTVVHAAAQLREDLRRRAPRGEDEEHVAEASLVAAVLLRLGGPLLLPRPSDPAPPPSRSADREAPPLPPPPLGVATRAPTPPPLSGAA